MYYLNRCILVVTFLFSSNFQNFVYKSDATWYVFSLLLVCRVTRLKQTPFSLGGAVKSNGPAAGLRWRCDVTGHDSLLIACNLNLNVTVVIICDDDTYPHVVIFSLGLYLCPWRCNSVPFTDVGSWSVKICMQIINWNKIIININGTKSSLNKCKCVIINLYILIRFAVTQILHLQPSLQTPDED